MLKRILKVVFKLFIDVSNRLVYLFAIVGLINIILYYNNTYLNYVWLIFAFYYAGYSMYISYSIFYRKKELDND